ncbi:MAG TPA: hypothetical protein VMN36_08905 [Verrucomicrobiales bacterium]|nr:hypothetical protein [Verrucomicrobiales bacterium]
MSIPQLAEFEKRYSKRGFQAIGIHAQAGTDEQIREWCKDNRVEFPMAKSGRSPIEINGIPRMFVFDQSGKLIYDGRPGDEAETLIKRQLRKSPATGDAAAPDASARLQKPQTLIEERTWTNAEGATLRAALLSVEGENGIFRRPDGNTFTYALSKLSKEDAALAREKASAGAEP